MNTENFIKLYKKIDRDEAITPFSSEVGFSLIRNYPKDTPYHVDGKKIFIKIAILKDRFFYSVDMTKPEKMHDKSINYVITTGEEYRTKITNFYSDNQEPFTFDKNTNKIFYEPRNKFFTLNEFVDILIYNHLSDRLFFKRKLNTIADKSLKLLFWLSDKYYERVRVSIDKYHFSRDNQPVKEDEKNIEPFFKYFYISKNIIFSILLLIFLLAMLSIIFPNIVSPEAFWPFGEFSLSNPFIVLFFFLVLFMCEKFSIVLNKKIMEFFEKESFQKKNPNFIERLHNYQYNNKFELKIS